MQALLKSERCHETGELGLRIDGVTLGDPDDIVVGSTGVLIAHDLLEHVNGLSRIGTIEDEFEACGGIWWVRGQHCDMVRSPNINTPHQHVSSELEWMFEKWVYARYGLCESKRTRSCDFDDDFEDILRLTEDHIRFGSTDHTKEQKEFYLREAMSGMRRGVRKAKRRFPNSCVANSIFWEVAERVDKVLEWAEFEGQEFILHYDIARCRASVDEVHEERW